MAKQINTCVGGVIKKVSKVPITVGGVVKEAKKGVCGVGGVVKTFYEKGLILYDYGNNPYGFTPKGWASFVTMKTDHIHYKEVSSWYDTDGYSGSGGRIVGTTSKASPISASSLDNYTDVVFVANAHGLPIESAHHLLLGFGSAAYGNSGSVYGLGDYFSFTTGIDGIYEYHFPITTTDRTNLKKFLKSNSSYYMSLQVYKDHQSDDDYSEWKWAELDIYGIYLV